MKPKNSKRSLSNKKKRRKSSRIKKNPFPNLDVPNLKIQYWGKNLISSQENDDSLKLPTSDNISQINPGDNHLFIKTQKNKYFGFGDNSLYQLGISNMKIINESLELKLPQLKKIKNIFCGSYTSFAIDNENRLFSWGINCSGQLGLGNRNNAKEPTLVNSNQKNYLKLLDNEYIKSIVGGGLHTILYTNLNRLFSSGEGKHYALGHGTSKSYCSFKLIEYFFNIKKSIEKIGVGVNHSGCLINGKLYVWGKFGYDKRCLSPKPNVIPMNSDVVDFVMGDVLTVVLTIKGDVYTLGDDIDGQLGVKNAKLGHINHVKLGCKIDFISCGFNHVICGSNKMIYGWGSNKDYQLQPGLDKQIFNSPFELNWLHSTKPNYILCHSFQTYILTTKKIDFNLILSPEEKMKERLQKEVENLKVEYINQKTKNNQLKQNVKKLHGALSVISKTDNESIKDPYEKSNLKK